MLTSLHAPQPKPTKVTLRRNGLLTTLAIAATLVLVATAAV
jgi:hypothetical protein